MAAAATAGTTTTVYNLSTCQLAAETAATALAAFTHKRKTLAEIRIQAERQKDPARKLLCGEGM